jgi:hypothetical protein
MRKTVLMRDRTYAPLDPTSKANLFVRLKFGNTYNDIAFKNQLVDEVDVPPVAVASLNAMVVII